MCSERLTYFHFDEVHILYFQVFQHKIIVILFNHFSPFFLSISSKPSAKKSFSEIPK